ncbi:diaminopimelate decarboxylase [Campylobacter blaseri]|uniref:Diaminopimelate decarboxylase n=1 Tax=Campylobacter blaseri TaxID=2042961 RepID=A0A2P8R169_9BACT|nr:diaminopimelate decarboxylase [Campylobacter blaseri]PSM52231.1 diaminopimelate decarboxylase [Campylobacter blaseri]PSM53997.1 diaminopimelate decarboxylase [Campylobacter blaseri]QKF85435.1 diaminopimelate decarboxylase [Campylobacter blaseri]
MNYENLANTYGTPLYIYNFDEVKLRYLELKESFYARKSLICYAVKANSNLSLLKYLANLGAGFDCVSYNEVKKALLAGALKYKIIFSGVGKKDSEIKSALKDDILMINIESFAELNRVEAIAKELNIEARISIRVNPNIDPKTHPYISTGLNENKFGVSIDEAKRMYIKAKNSKFLNPIGIHFHIGSQLSDIKPIHEAASIVAKLMKELKTLEIDIKFFDIGGGIGVRYKDEKEINLYEYAQGILAALKGQDVTIVCEIGRFLVSKAGELLTKVLYEKINNNKRFVIVDSAMNDLLRPSLYDAYHKIVALNGNDELFNCDIVGPVCESGDFLGKNRELPNLKSGDLLVVKNVGAYGFSMSSNYNSRLRAAEIAIINNKIKLIRKRETFEDLIANEVDLLGEE